jgi:hypothetical protein
MKLPTNTKKRIVIINQSKKRIHKKNKNTKKNIQKYTKKKQIGGKWFDWFGNKGSDTIPETELKIAENRQYQTKIEKFRNEFIEIIFLIMEKETLLQAENKRLLNNSNITKKDKKLLTQEINTHVQKLIHFFENNRTRNRGLINIKIPINKDKSICLDKNLCSIDDYIPIPIIIIDQIQKKDSKKLILDSFYKNGGILLQESNKKKNREDVFTYVIKNERADDLKILLNLVDSENRHILTRNMLQPEHQVIFDKLTKIKVENKKVEDKKVEDKPVQVEDKSVEDKPVEEIISIDDIKIQPENVIIPLLLPVNIQNPGYDINRAPEFWKPLFGRSAKLNNSPSGDEDEQIMLNLRENIRNIDMCAVVKQFFPSYKTQSIVAYKDYELINQSLCKMLILLGIISYKMIEQDYNFIFTGGKAIQFLLSDNSIRRYESDDIDILIIPNNNIPYNKEHIENLSAHIGFLLKWFLPNISIELPNSSVYSMGKEIVKVAYQYQNTKKFKALSDIGFHIIKEDTRHFFMNPKMFQLHIPDLNMEALFRCPSLEAILDEKLYYYLDFVDLKEKLKKEPVVIYNNETKTKDDLSYIMQKFKRSINVILDELITENDKNTTKDEIIELKRFKLKEFLTHIDNVSHDLNEKAVANILDPNPYN